MKKLALVLGAGGATILALATMTPLGAKLAPAPPDARLASTPQSARPAPAPSGARLAPTPPPDDPQVEALVDEVLANPGYTGQICSMMRYVGDTPAFRPYQFFRGEDKISARNYARLREHRAGVIAVVCERLPQIIADVIADWERENRAYQQHPHGLMSYTHSHALAILIDLNAVEALPTLLDLLERAEGPDQILQRGDILSTITGILRQERYAPVLESELEAMHAARHVRGFKPPPFPGDAIPLDKREFYTRDPVDGDVLYFGRMPTHGVDVEVTPELQARIVGWAEDFLASVPREEWLGAEGMTPWPVVR